MADRYNERERPWWRGVEDEDRYGRNRSRYSRDRDYGQQVERGYGYGDYGQEDERRSGRDWEYERRGLVERDYGYGDYGQEYNRERDYNQRQQYERSYGYGDYGQDYGRRYRPERDYTREQTGRGYGYGEYDQGYERRYGSDWDYDRGWQGGRDYGDYGRRPGRYTEPTWSYTEVWLVPGPATGMGPQGYQRSNERIIEDACERLTHHGRVDASGIEIEVDNGIVTLEGTVDSRQQKRMAEDAVETVRGVRDVRNRLEVKREGGW